MKIMIAVLLVVLSNFAKADWVEYNEDGSTKIQTYMAMCYGVFQNSTLLNSSFVPKVVQEISDKYTDHYFMTLRLASGNNDKILYLNLEKLAQRAEYNTDLERLAEITQFCVNKYKENNINELLVKEIE